MQKIVIQNAHIQSVDLKTRMPFKYGIATMTSFPLVFITVHCEIDGIATQGIASDLLPPKWFKKDPNQSPSEELAELRSVIEHACDISSGLKGNSVFHCWQQLYQEQAVWGKQQNHPPLLYHFGTSLIERALIDAFCRHHQTTFFQALKENSFGIQLDTIHPTLDQTTLAKTLPNTPLTSIIARHTVGLSDPLTDSEIDPKDRLDDGLPQSLESCMRTYGLKHLKIKICGNFETDRQRLIDISHMVTHLNLKGFGYTLDGNEQFESMAGFRDYWNQLKSIKNLEPFMSHLIFVEQPLHRDVALNPDVSNEMSAWKDRPNMIIDESDGSLGSAAKAIRLGYSGTSHKNCKGIFKSIANRALINHLSMEHPSASFIMSGEDLCNQGPIAVMQDLCVAASLGIQSVERNGHHYCAGLSHHPASVQKQMLDCHVDTYHPSPSGWPTLHIHDGQVSTQSINQAPFGIHFIPTISDYNLTT